MTGDPDAADTDPQRADLYSTRSALETPLGDARSTIEALADDDGTYRIVGARRGEEPVPARGLRFESRETAKRAARAVERYRAVLREHDPDLPSYQVIVRPTRRVAVGDDGVRSTRSTAKATRSS